MLLVATAAPRPLPRTDEGFSLGKFTTLLLSRLLVFLAPLGRAPTPPLVDDRIFLLDLSETSVDENEVVLGRLRRRYRNWSNSELFCGCCCEVAVALLAFLKVLGDDAFLADSVSLFVFGLRRPLWENEEVEDPVEEETSPTFRKLAGATVFDTSRFCLLFDVDDDELLADCCAALAAS